MSEREIKADADRALALLHQLARDIVDGGDVIGVDRVPQAEGIGEQRRAQQHRLVMQRDERPQPDENIAADERAVERDQTTAQARVGGAKQTGHHIQHNTLVCLRFTG